MIDKKRVHAPAWEHAPGWREEDICVGKEYGELLKSSFGVNTIQALAEKSPKDLARLWNSDNHTTNALFNNIELTNTAHDWNKHLKKQRESIPICKVNGEDMVLEPSGDTPPS